MADEPEENGDLETPPHFFPTDFGGDERLSREEFGEPIEVGIEGVFAAEQGGSISRFVLLGEGDRRLPILIGPYESQAISLPLEGTRPDRPMTHDLVRNILERLDVVIDRVVIDDLWNAIYYAKIYMKHKGSEIEIDARPSDAIAMAVRFDAPIFVAEGILESGGE